MASISSNAERPPACLTARLHHLTLSTPDPRRLGIFYRDVMNCRLREAGDVVIAEGQERRVILAPGAPNGLIDAGFALADLGELDRLRARIDSAGWSYEAAPNAFFVDALAVRDPDGARLVFGVPLIDGEASAVLVERPARLQHIVMASRDPDRVTRFFRDVLGFTLSDNVVDEVGDVRTSFLRCSGEHHSFAIFKASENRLDHHCYETRDWNAIRDWADHLAAQGVRIQWGPGRHGPGNNLFLFIHDPDGNWLEISAELEIVSHDRPVGTWPHCERTLNAWGPGRLRS
jgi:catechol 2,3-dioxygenase